MTATVPDTVARSREQWLPGMRGAIQRLDLSTQQVVNYHFGWAEADGRPVDNSGGKALRPALAMLSAQAAGAPAEVGVPGAIAVELIHNFSLLHDDVMDGDVQRRHRPTVWTIWGTSTAILVGDALQALASEVLAEVPAPAGAAAAHLMATCTRRLIVGQVDDLAFEQRDTIKLDECLTMAAGKTGALLGCAAAIGAVLAEAPPETVTALSTYGEEMGLAFQLVDDLLGIWGETAVTGKPVGADLRARKKSLPITYALTQDCPAARELELWLATDDADRDADVLLAAALVEVAGGREWAANEATRRLGLAEAALLTAPIPTGVRDELVELARFVVERDS
jgi:geranylgeranyl diphosphate synthase type I